MRRERSRYGKLSPQLNYLNFRLSRPSSPARISISGEGTACKLLAHRGHAERPNFTGTVCLNVIRISRSRFGVLKSDAADTRSVGTFDASGPQHEQRDCDRGRATPRPARGIWPSL